MFIQKHKHFEVCQDLVETSEFAVYEILLVFVVMLEAKNGLFHDLLKILLVFGERYNILDGSLLGVCQKACYL